MHMQDRHLLRRLCALLGSAALVFAWAVLINLLTGTALLDAMIDGAKILAAIVGLFAVVVGIHTLWD